MNTAIRFGLMLVPLAASLLLVGGCREPSSKEVPSEGHHIVLDDTEPGQNAPPEIWQGTDSGIVCLQTGPAFREPSQPCQQGILGRELIRQSLLIAARDGLGLTTRDEVQREDFGNGSHMLMTPKIQFQPGEQITVSFHKGEVSNAQLGSPIQLPYMDTNRFDEFELLERTEELSRGELLHRLKNEGLQGEQNRWAPDAKVPEEIEGHLSQMTIVAQFAAVRELHRVIRESGESVARLGALSQAYAQLGLLTEHHVSAAHVAYKARSLLYALRIGWRTGDIEQAGPYVAFAWTLAGYHAHARACPGVAELENPPKWVEVMLAHLDRDIRILRRQFEDPQVGHLARVLHFFNMSVSGAPQLTLNAGQELLSVIPECDRVLDAMCDVGGLSDLHQLTTFGPEVMSTGLPGRLKSFPGLPDSIQEKCDAERAILALLR